MQKTQKLAIYLLLGIIAGVILSNATIFDDQEQFKKLKASEKSDIIWKNVIMDSGSKGREIKPTEEIHIMVPSNLGGISLKDTLGSFVDLFSQKKEVKVGHTFGHVFKFKFKPNTDNVQKLNLSGIFNGSEYGIGRFSSANRIAHSRSRASIGLKFLRDG